jgi:N-acetylmuramoyl-L-alanine amidase
MRRSFASVVLVVALSAMAGPVTPAGAVAAIDATGDTASFVAKPPIVWKPIPYGSTRRRQMAAYSKRHYGTWSWHLDTPHVIIEHYTDGTSFSSAWNYMAANVQHNGEYPGVCSHFIVDTDGTIYQLAPLDLRCRHAVGMNYTAIGIEHVGTSDQMVLNDRRQMHSAIRLTLWLMERFHINIGNVIGHNETLESPYHRELYASWRCLVHADFPHWAMKKYRTRVRELAAARDAWVGAGPVWVDSGC